jgi:hypothetical protein
VVRRLLCLLCAGAGALRAQGSPTYWLSEGYGSLLEIRADQLHEYEITSVSCIAGLVADRETDGTTFRMRGAPVKFTLTPGNNPDERWLHPAGTASSRLFRRVSARPGVCSRTTPSDPLTSYDVLWTTFAEQYGFFGLRGIDWGSVNRRYRSSVTSTTTPAELFQVFKEMLEPLHDAHTYVGAEDPTLRFHGSRVDPHPLSDGDRQKAWEIVESRYLKTKPRRWCNERVSYGLLNDSIGYLRITGFSGYTDDRDYDHGTAALEAALDTIFQGSDRMRGLVIDVRLNGGGNDPWGVAIASRLTAQPYLAFAKQARADIHDASRWTSRQDTRATPGPRPHFLGKVVELTGINSVSAAETFTMALMGRMPHITRVGEATQGVFSDVMGRTLPNGWKFGLPNERFLSADGVAFDGPGVPPDIEVPVFTRSDLDAGRDGALERAITVLGESP